MNLRQIELGERNRAAVRALMVTHLGISRVEIAAKLNLSPMAVTRHVTAIRNEWGGEALPTRRAALAPSTSAQDCASQAEA